MPGSRLLRSAAFVLAGVLALLAPAAAVVPPDWAPRAGEFVWRPEVSPAGPVVVVVSLPLQQVHVYRNGVRIGASTISTGKRGHETPTGVFTILQKRAEHYSNLYDNAPMPWMQRLTWDGIALHAGRLPGHPASHGCIRLPDAFAKLLFSTTRRGDVVVVTNRSGAPGMVAGGDVVPAAARSTPGSRTVWNPEAAASGPVSVVLSTADRRIVVHRNGVRIGEASLHVAPGLRLGTRAFVMLEGRLDAANAVIPERPARKWMAIDVGSAGDDHAVRSAFQHGDLAVSPEMARRIDDVLHPGATVLITDEPMEGEAHVGPLELEAVH